MTGKSWLKPVELNKSMVLLSVTNLEDFPSPVCLMSQENYISQNLKEDHIYYMKTEIVIISFRQAYRGRQINYSKALYCII